MMKKNHPIIRLGVVPKTKIINMDEKKTKVIRIILGTLIPIIYTIIYIPPGVTMIQIISAILVFLVIIYFAVKALKYYEII